VYAAVRVRNSILQDNSLSRTEDEGHLGEEYAELMKQRLRNNDESQAHLQERQAQECAPWETASLSLAGAGSLALLAAACLLVFGRYCFELTTSLRSSRSLLAPWAFTTPCVITVGALAYLEVLLFRARHFQRLSRDQRTRAVPTERSMPSGHLLSTPSSKSPSQLFRRLAPKLDVRLGTVSRDVTVVIMMTVFGN